MRKHLTSLLAAGAAIVGLAAAGPAHAATLPLPSDPAFKVPAGKIEHDVTVTQVSGKGAVPSHLRNELWLTATSAKSIVRDADTGKLKAETVATPTETRTFEADSGVLIIERSDKPQGLPFNSAAFEAAVQKAYVEQDITQVVGETTVNGRRALITQSVAQNWRSDEPGGVTTAVVDAENYTLYQRSSVNDRIGFRQDETITTELLDATPANVKATMAMKQRPHTKVKRRVRR